MNHEQLWAPWRSAYITGQAEKDPEPARPLEFLEGADPACFICRGLADANDRGHRIVRRGLQTVTVINRYPYNNGHLLIAPQRHVGQLDLLDSAERLECLETLSTWVRIIESRMNADGFNIGLNLGRVAGAGLPGHLHWHLVPRWNGDTNFMPVLTGARVISQSLDALWEILTAAAASEF